MSPHKTAFLVFSALVACALPADLLASTGKPTPYFRLSRAKGGFGFALGPALQSRSRQRRGIALKPRGAFTLNGTKVDFNTLEHENTIVAAWLYAPEHPSLLIGETFQFTQIVVPGRKSESLTNAVLNRPADVGPIDGLGKALCSVAQCSVLDAMRSSARRPSDQPRYLHIGLPRGSRSDKMVSFEADGASAMELLNATLDLALHFGLGVRVDAEGNPIPSVSKWSN